MYLISTNGVLVYYSIEKKEDSKPVFDEPNLLLTPNCADCDYSRGLLLIDAAQSNQSLILYFDREQGLIRPLREEVQAERHGPLSNFRGQKRLAEAF